MATNDEVINEVRGLKADMCKRLEQVEGQVDDHEKRLIAIESAVVAEIKHLAKEVAEFKAMWFKITLILLALIAVLAGAQQVIKVITGG